MDNQIISYMSEQLPDIKDSYEHALADGSSEIDFLEGIVEAYSHIIEKFSYEAP
jgi:hypothetical protein